MNSMLISVTFVYTFVMPKRFLKFPQIM